MTKPKLLSVELPFQGFYESDFSHEIDREAEQWAEYELGRDGGENIYPPELQVPNDWPGLQEILFNRCSYGDAHREVAREYVDWFACSAGDAIGLPLALIFEEMTSPREYNFTTDRVFASIPLATVKAMFARHKADDFATLGAAIAKRHTSYDGFCSFYPNDLASWRSKPVAQWDHIELGTLLLATLKLSGASMREIENDIFEGMSGNGVFSNAWSNAVDWEAVERDCEDYRAERLAELRESDPARWSEITGLELDSPDSGFFLPAVRCDKTLDLFA